jgi:DNA helicase II / ATP-dependent DNA helicase PcrA
MEWSPYQLAIFEAVEKTKDSLIIEAVAGAGKTTVIVEAIKHVPATQPIAFLAFNKVIADELKRRVTSPNARCMTLHSVGFSAWRKYLGGNSWSCKVDSGKTRSIFQEFDIEDRVRYGAEIVKLVSIAKGQGIVPRERAEEFKGLVEDDDEVWEEMIDFYDLDRDGCSIEVAREVLSRSIDAAPGMIDFDDQLFMPVIAGAPFDKYDVIFLDESQDINGIQAEIVDRMRKTNSRVIAVGDPHQSIYQWRGALSNSMEQIKQRFNCRSLPLSISYRCPKNIVKKAQEYVSHIQAFEAAPDGLVTESVASWPLKRFLPTDVILCRNTRPLIEMAFLLIRNKVSCRVLGRDIGQGLVKLVKKMKSFNVGDLTKKLRTHRMKEAQKFTLQGKEDKIAALDDRLDTLQVFMDELGVDAPVSELISAIEALFSDEQSGRLTLSTIHKFKGGEADRVFILDPFLMPSKWARQQWQKEGEQNLQYVAVTRAKKELYYVTSETLRSAECLENLDSGGSLPSPPTPE